MNFFPPVICSSWDGGHYAVHLSLQGRSRQLTRLRTQIPTSAALPYSLLWKMLWCEKRHVAWWAGPQMYDFMLMSARVQGLLCVFVPLVTPLFRSAYPVIHLQWAVKICPSPFTPIQASWTWSGDHWLGMIRAFRIYLWELTAHSFTLCTWPLWK